MATTLKTARYLNLSTYRRTGEPVNTPVWFAERNGAWYVFSAGDAGKVKRLRNSSRARVAPCNARGRLLGDWVEAHAMLVTDAAERDAAYRALRGKYGWQMGLLDFFSRLGGRIGQREVIRIRPGSGSRPKARAGARRG